MAPNSKDKWVRRFLINETSRHKKGFTVYKVTSVIYPKAAPEAVSRVSVWKRYNDFRKLYLELSSRQDATRLKDSFPPFPKPKFFGRFEAEVIEERRQCAIRLLEFIGKHTALFTSNVFVKFFESGHSWDCLTTDCSVSLSSDTSEDDPNVSALRGTNYVPTNHCEAEKKHSASPGQNLTCLATNNNYIDEIHSTGLDDRKMGLDRPLASSPEPKIPQFTSSSVLDGSDLSGGGEQDSPSYILVAAAHMSAAFRHEALAEFDQAFTQYKLGISNLLDGVRSDDNAPRRDGVKAKIAKYLERAEKLYNRHLNCNVSVVSRPPDELRNYKVLRVMGSVMLVRDTERECNRVIKTVQKPAGNAESLSDYILRGKVPFMVQLYGCIETESTVFLVLQNASGGKLWEYMKSYYKGRTVVASISDKGHTRSASCDALIQSTVGVAEAGGSRVPIRETKIDARVLEPEEKAAVDPEESLKKLEEEFGANSTCEKNFPTPDLLAKAQALLRSVDATIKRSNSIASRLHESGNLPHRKEKMKSDEALSNSVESRSKFSMDESSEVSEIDRPLKRTKESLNSDNFQSLVAEDSGIEMDDELWKLPEGTIRFWAAEILLTLESLHEQDVVVGDLRPNNILLGSGGHVAMSYVVPGRGFQFLKLEKPYTAPELFMHLPNAPATTAADVWSYGVLLYELFTGIQFQSKHPGAFHSHSMLNIPEELSSNVKSLISNVLRFRPEERLTIPEIKKHPFFSSIDWDSLLNSSFT